MIEGLINRYKNHRKQSFLNKFGNYKHRYAFVGVGGHSASNLYPIIDYLGVPLKYICTKGEENASKMAAKYAGTIGTNNLDKVLSDPEIAGVFLCTSPQSHFQLAKKILAAGKHLFVEKPPCFTVAELQQLISLKKNDQHVVVGLQKRYSTVVEHLEKLKGTIDSYSYAFKTGAYPEGDPIMDLYIHSLDVINHLFGEVTQVQKMTSKSGETTLVNFTHSNGIIGQAELSTGHSWKSASEEFSVVTDKGIYQSNGINHLELTRKSGTVLGIPLEKVRNKPVITEQIFDNDGFVPLAEFNELYTHGYHGEIDAFVSACEGQKSNNKTSLESVMSTLKLIEKLRN